MAYELTIETIQSTNWKQIWINWVRVTLAAAITGYLFASFIDFWIINILVASTPKFINPSTGNTLINTYYSGRSYIYLLFAMGIFSSLQWRSFLRHYHFVRMQWIGMTLLGAIIGTGLLDGLHLFITIDRSELVWRIISAVIMGTSIGLAQWFVLRSYADTARWWVLASISTYLLVNSLWYVSVGASTSILQRAAQLNTAYITTDNAAAVVTFWLSFIFVISMSILSGGIMGLVNGTITGPIMATIIETINESQQPSIPSTQEAKIN